MERLHLSIFKIILLIFILTSSCDSKTKWLLAVIWLVKFVADADVYRPGHSGLVYKLTKKMSFEMGEIIVAIIQLIPATTFVAVAFGAKVYIPAVLGCLAIILPMGEIVSNVKDIIGRKKLPQKYKKFSNRKFSILGDSISTLAGYNPQGYNVFYQGENCTKTGIQEMNDTWWGKVIEHFNGELLVNNAWSGSRVTKISEQRTLFPTGCSDERTSSLHINDVKPDVIIVYIGTNDWANGVELAEDWYENEDHYWRGTAVLANEECFDVAYQCMLEKLKTNYPKSEIWCCTLCETYISEIPEFKFPHKYAGTHIEKYNEIIRKLANKYKCKLIDLYKFKMPYDSIDGIHPTEKGMHTIADMVIRGMKG